MGKRRRSIKRPHFTALKPRDAGMILLGALVVFVGVVFMHAMTPKELPMTSAKTITSPWIPASVKRWQPLIQEMAHKYDIDPNLVAIIMTIESGGNPQARSGVGAEGLMQIMPGTAKDIAQKYLTSPVKSYDILDPRTNIEFGTAYLAYLRNEFGSANQGPTWNETAELIGAGYNGGPGAASNVEKGRGLESLETASYSRDVFNMWRERDAPQSPTYTRWLERGGSSLVSKAEAQK